ncbi:MAG: AmmeMemoRadiSam system protein B [Acidobacteriia bacterium]|nr:AmmeMemoRadiSam system protein B [Terriglobia bacterium]
MLRLPAVAGRFYPSQAGELRELVLRCAAAQPGAERARVRACLVPHAGYVYSGAVAGAVYARIALPRRMVLLGVRHQPRGANAAILSSGAWRTPLGDAPVDAALAAALRAACPLLREDEAAHRSEHSLEVQLPFLQVLAPEFSFVPVVLGTLRFEELAQIGEGLRRVLAAEPDVLLVATSDLNHYEDDATTRVKDAKAVERLLARDARGLFEVCLREEISMCGLGPAVALLTALGALEAPCAELVRYATSAEVSGDRNTVVGYAGMVFG